jgi:hypothetical protein
MKQIILKNPETGKYFTNDYRDNYWSREIKEAYCFDNEAELNKRIASFDENGDTTFRDEKILVLETIYKF